MLNELQQGVVNKCYEIKFGGFLFGALMEYSSLQKEIKKRQYPGQSRLISVNEGMNLGRKGFDVRYFLILPHEEVNPLQVEQEAWKLLSPHVKEYVRDFGIYVEGYSPLAQVDQQQLLTYIDKGLNLLQQWNIISRSYKAKYFRLWEEVGGREDVVRKLIQELQASLVTDKPSISEMNNS